METEEQLAAFREQLDQESRTPLPQSFVTQPPPVLEGGGGSSRAAGASRSPAAPAPAATPVRTTLSRQHEALATLPLPGSLSGMDSGSCQQQLLHWPQFLAHIRVSSLAPQVGSLECQPPLLSGRFARRVLQRQSHP